MTTTPSKPKIWQRRWFVPAVCALAGLMVGVGVGSSGDATTTAGEPAPAATVTVTAEPEAAPTVTETVTVEAVPVESEPAPEPESVEGEVTSADVETALGIGTDWEPTWAAPITELNVRGSTLEVRYQEQLLDSEKVELGQFIHNFVRSGGLAFSTIVVTDTSGIDFNVFCGTNVCADSVSKTD